MPRSRFIGEVGRSEVRSQKSDLRLPTSFYHIEELVKSSVSSQFPSTIAYDKQKLRGMSVKEYNRMQALEYAKKWAYARNPAYYNFDPVGGDCTSFVSQCIYAGAKIMNYQKDTGWYYRSGSDKSPSWTGVEFLYNFLTKNKGKGPFGSQTTNIEVGDIAQISFDGEKFAHSLFIVDTGNGILENSLVATHTFDSYGRSISTYSFQKIRFVHIEGIRT